MCYEGHFAIIVCEGGTKWKNNNEYLTVSNSTYNIYGGHGHSVLNITCLSKLYNNSNISCWYKKQSSEINLLRIQGKITC